jgi:hypothetical protein
MATKEKLVELDPLTSAVIRHEEKDNEPKVPVFIPALEDSGSAGVKVDQYEHVTIANESKEECWKVLRGETVEVPVRVFIALKERYPKI